MHKSLRRLKSLSVTALVAFVVTTAASGQVPDRFALETDDSIVVVGNTFAEKLAMSGYIEALIQSAYPAQHVSVRHIPWGAEEVGQQYREQGVPDTNAYLVENKADVIIAFFGMSESFAGEAGLGAFETDLAALIDGWRAARFSGEEPRIILVSPIAHENTGTPGPTPSAIDQHNESIAQYVEVMRRIASDKEIRFVDLFAPSTWLYGSTPGLTSNGIHPNERGCRAFTREIGVQLGWVPGDGASSVPSLGPAPDPAVSTALRQLAWNKYYHMRFIYRPTNTQYVWGRRVNPYGAVNFPAEQAQLRRMVAARQRAIWDLDKPTPAQLFAAPSATSIENVPVWEAVPDSSLLPEDQWEPPAVEAKGTETSLGDMTILPPATFAESFTVADGYEVNCFASEQDFPELQNALAIKFDDQHRLWVLCSPTYPHLLPGDQPGDRLIVLSDEDGDGKADKVVVFADDLGETIATGFVIDKDAVYVAQSPELLKLTDTDGDGRADRREVVVTGFSMPDAHHQISALEWTPDGGIALIEGTFASTNVETPFGTRRGRGSAVWRYDPRTGRLDALSHNSFPNPWGLVFDDYGAGVFDSTSGGAHYDFSQMITAFDYPRKPATPKAFLNRGRPTSGNEIIASRQFPAEAQSTHLVGQVIGFHGLRWDRLSFAGSGWTAEPMPQDLIQSTDANFRPVAIETGPDGTLFVADWSNPLIGHMQYSVRDPRRDHTHARIWRIKYTANDLVEPPTLHGASVEQLLDALRLPERNTRAIARRSMQAMDPGDVLGPLTNWLATLSLSDPLHDRLVLEGLWIKQGLGIVDMDLAEAALASPSVDVRAAVVRLVRLWLQSEEIDNKAALALLTRTARDPDMRVRLETVVACGFAQGQEAGVIAQIVREYDMDEAFEIVLRETLIHLNKFGTPDSAFAKAIRLGSLSHDAFMAEPWDDIAAAVALTRTDVDASVYSRSLETLAPEASGRLGVLVTAILDADDPAATAAALKTLVLDSLQSASSQEPLALLAKHDSSAVRALGSAGLVHSGASVVDLLARDANAAIEGTAMLEDRMLSDQEASAIMAAVDANLVAPTTALQLVTTRATPSIETTVWFTNRIESVKGVGFESWGRPHEVAMAALRALAMAPDAGWEDPLSGYVQPQASAQFAAGERVYFDEALGCVRCHGLGGEGLPGFPPLQYSPWLLGDPARPATIVIHGLQGEVSVAGGETFSSVMAPLGASLSDEQIASALTFARQSFGNFASAVDVAVVTQARKPVSSETLIPTTSALLAAFPFENDRLVPGDTSGVIIAGTSSPTGSGRMGPISRLQLVLALVVVLAIVYFVLRKIGQR
jgi:mono/diheme cytochrome c family protein